MAKIKILQYPDPRLNKKAIPVKDVHDPRIQQIIDDITETLVSTENCAALAASQMDIIDPPALTVIDRSADEGGPFCLINPEILDMSDFDELAEGCMSIFPQELYVKVRRAKKIKVRAQNRQGETIEFEAHNLLAHTIQHETDHLNGILYIDRLSPLKRAILKKKIAKLFK